jgi:hypothetical protein
MGIFGKKIKDEEFFYNYIKTLTPMELLNLTKAMARFMSDFNELSLSYGGLLKKPIKKDKKDRVEVS